MVEEFQVYDAVLNWLERGGWRIICASPPGGTDRRFKKCLLPRRGIHEKGPRDELDVTALKGDAILILECKPSLSDSLNKRNALGESDKEKLERITESFPPMLLKTTLEQGHSLKLPDVNQVIPGLCVGKLNASVPADMLVLEMADGGGFVVHAPASSIPGIDTLFATL
jgi:hypothetical protein